MYVDEAMLALDCLQYRSDPRSMPEGLRGFDAELNTYWFQWDRGLQFRVKGIPEGVPVIYKDPADA